MIAKPISELSIEDRIDWSRFCEKLAESGQEVPISQTIPWAIANASLGAQSVLIYDPEAQVGGVLFTLPDPNSDPKWECQNGPLTLTNEPSRLAHWLVNTHGLLLETGSSHLSLRPRIRSDQSAVWKSLDVPYASENLAATWILNAAQASTLFTNQRLKRTLCKTVEALVNANFAEATLPKLLEFSTKYENFCRSKKLFTPGFQWFRTLMYQCEIEVQNSTTDFRLWLGEATCLAEAPKGETSTEVSAMMLVYQTPFSAHYIHGYQDRKPRASRLSPSALLHKIAFDHLHERGIKTYDLNGASVRLQTNESPSHTIDSRYQGVDAFKEQFGGDYVSYRQPEILISL